MQYTELTSGIEKLATESLMDVDTEVIVFTIWQIKTRHRFELKLIKILYTYL